MIGCAARRRARPRASRRPSTPARRRARGHPRAGSSSGPEVTNVRPARTAAAQAANVSASPSSRRAQVRTWPSGTLARSSCPCPPRAAAGSRHRGSGTTRAMGGLCERRVEALQLERIEQPRVDVRGDLRHRQREVRADGQAAQLPAASQPVGQQVGHRAARWGPRAVRRWRTAGPAARVPRGRRGRACSGGSRCRPRRRGGPSGVDDVAAEVGHARVMVAPLGGQQVDDVRRPRRAPGAAPSRAPGSGRACRRRPSRLPSGAQRRAEPDVEPSAAERGRPRRVDDDLRRDVHARARPRSSRRPAGTSTSNVAGHVGVRRAAEQHVRRRGPRRAPG